MSQAPPSPTSTGPASAGPASAGASIAATLWADRSQEKRTRSLETPEGVLLPVVLPSHTTRVAALMIDFAFWALASIALAIATVLSLFANALLFPLFILVGGLVRNFYFLFFELTWQGRTPGKRLMNLRVVDRKGGPLLSRAVVARNLLREIEISLPLSLLFVGSQGGWGTFLMLLWSLIFLLFPLFNRDHMRCGDLIAGTWVIELPRAVLADDLTTAAASAATDAQSTAVRTTAEQTDAEPFVFTDQQLRRYEIHHLRILEEVLRRPESPQAHELRVKIAATIATKIVFDPPPLDEQAGAFLTAFYTQFRKHLEVSQIFGRSKPPAI